MKKLITSASLLLLSFATFGQGLTSKKGHAILPEAKDWSISFDAVPFLDYAFDKTRIFSNTPPSSAASALDFQTPMTIVGKYMIDENTAYRAKARFGINRTSKDTLVNKVLPVWDSMRKQVGQSNQTFPSLQDAQQYAVDFAKNKNKTP